MAFLPASSQLYVRGSRKRRKRNRRFCPDEIRCSYETNIDTFNKSGRHLEFSMNDVIRGKIIHVAKMATKDESSVDVDFAVCSCKKESFYFISRGIFSLCLYGYVIVTLKLSCKDIPGSMISRANES